MSDYTPAGRQGLQKQITRIMEHRDPLTERIMTCCYRVHTGLGPGFVVENKIIVEVKAVTGNIPDVFKY